MFETKGRRNLEAYVDGQLYVVKKPVKFNSTFGVLIPKDWVDAVCNGKELTYFLLDIKDTFITIKPYFEELPEEVA